MIRQVFCTNHTNKQNNMQKVILIFILFLITIKGFSKCASHGLYFWPSGKTVNENSVFVIEGYQMSQQIITLLGTTHRAYLQSDQQIINLKVKEVLIGQFSLTQAILIPEKNLTVGLEYELIITNLKDPSEEVSRANESTGKKEKVKWIVAAGKDTTAPVWTSTPAFENGTYQMYGCGPAVSANFTFSATDKSEFLIKTIVKNISTGKETTYYLKKEGDIIQVGHGMCSGAFTFKDGEQFEVEFSLLDASGNFTTWTGRRIKFKRPS